eukprot:gene20972-25189_t
MHFVTPRSLRGLTLLIIKIDKRGGRVYVSYIYWESEYDEWVDNLAVRIAPKHQHTYIEGGRLKLGQRIEAIDERGEWLQAFVVEEDTDRVCVHYKGFAPKFDRWIRREEAPGNVRPFGRMRFQLRYLNASRRRDFLKNSNTKWSVPGMSTGLARATRLSAAAAAAAAGADPRSVHNSSIYSITAPWPATKKPKANKPKAARKAAKTKNNAPTPLRSHRNALSSSEYDVTAYGPTHPQRSPALHHHHHQQQESAREATARRHSEYLFVTRFASVSYETQYLL